MKLWILKPVERLPQGDDPWEPWYEKAFGFVARAETEDEARKFAHTQAGDENREMFFGGNTTNIPWLDAKYSTCADLTAEGDAGVVLKDFHAA